MWGGLMRRMRSERTGREKKDTSAGLQVQSQRDRSGIAQKRNLAAGPALKSARAQAACLMIWPQEAR